MRSKRILEMDVLMAARENGIESILFRNSLSKRLGLNLTESLCLTVLGIKGASTPTELARYTGLTTGATTTMLDRLENRKFIQRRPKLNDRRGVIIEIDTDYTKIAQKLVAGIQKAHRDLIASYSANDLKVITDFLRRFTANMKEHAEKIEAQDGQKVAL